MSKLTESSAMASRTTGSSLMSRSLLHTRNSSYSLSGLVSLINRRVWDEATTHPPTSFASVSDAPEWTLDEDIEDTLMSTHRSVHSVIQQTLFHVCSRNQCSMRMCSFQTYRVYDNFKCSFKHPLIWQTQISSQYLYSWSSSCLSLFTSLTLRCGPRAKFLTIKLSGLMSICPGLTH